MMPDAAGMSFIKRLGHCMACEKHARSVEQPLPGIIGPQTTTHPLELFKNIPLTMLNLFHHLDDVCVFLEALLLDRCFAKLCASLVVVPPHGLEYYCSSMSVGVFFGFCSGLVQALARETIESGLAISRG